MYSYIYFEFQKSVLATARKIFRRGLMPNSKNPNQLMQYGDVSYSKEQHSLPWRSKSGIDEFVSTSVLQPTLCQMCVFVFFFFRFCMLVNSKPSRCVYIPKISIRDVQHNNVQYNARLSSKKYAMPMFLFNSPVMTLFWLFLRCIFVVLQYSMLPSDQTELK